MATRNFVPRSNNEGTIGTSAKKWAGGFFTSLAVSAISTAVSVIVPAANANDAQPATTSWVRSQFQSILSTVLTATGVQYSMGTNGYICLGSLFGNAILQWGSTLVSTTETVITYPIAYTSYSRAVAALSSSTLDVFQDCVIVPGLENLKAKVTSTTQIMCWIAIGY